MRTETRSINRLAQGVRFFRVSRLLLWTIWVIYRERQRVVRARENGNYDVQPNIQVLLEVLIAFRQTALKLGVLMIKLGQFLSSRADLLPEQALAVLTSLQDEVPAEPFDHVVNIIESETNKPIEEVFSMIERKATAAASLGQVHKAVLAKTGETVAVKIQRPNTDQLVAMDLSTLKFVIWVITRFFHNDFIDLWGFYREFRRTVYEEIDFVTEAANAKRYKEMFKDDATIYIPYIYDEYVTRRFLVLEWIDGIKINDYAAIEAAGINRLEVATRTVNAYFYQFFDAGFFHADPHPGNILIKKGSPPNAPIVTFLDFGMVGTITKPMKRSMRDLFLSTVTSDAHLMVDALVKLGFIGNGANLSAIESAMSLMLQQYFGMSLGQLRNLDMSNVAQDISNLLYGQPFHIPAQFAFTGRAVSTLVGVSTGLAPDFNFIAVATPYARRFLGLDAKQAAETAQEIFSQLIDVSRTLIGLPRSVERLISKIETGQVEVKLANIPGARHSRRSGGRGNNNNHDNGITAPNVGGNASLTLMFLAALGSGIYLLKGRTTAPGWFCLGLAGLTALGNLLRR
jgi:predicted unusual protein kinase regulating ubiquinone biosynthesis (AarF/ABC1/UbiB family)